MAKSETIARLTDVEWTIMEVLWEQAPCAAGTVQEALAERQGWAYSTIKTTLDRMVMKGVLATKQIRNLTLYSTLISRDEARRNEIKNCLLRAFDGALSPMLQFLIEEKQLSESDLNELKRLVKRKK